MALGDRLRAVIVHRGATAETIDVDAIINCSGPQNSVVRAENPFLISLVEKGLSSPDLFDLGLTVDSQCRSIGGDNRPNEFVRILGGLTCGQFGDVTAIPQITLQIAEMLPQMVSILFDRR